MATSLEIKFYIPIHNQFNNQPIMVVSVPLLLSILILLLEQFNNRRIVGKVRHTSNYFKPIMEYHHSKWETLVAFLTKYFWKEGEIWSNQSCLLIEVNWYAND